MINVYMPRLGLSMQEGTIVQWHVSEGMPVKKGEGIVEITSEKIAHLVDADADGVVEKILYKVGDVVTSGEVIALLNENAALTGYIENDKPSPAKLSVQDPNREILSRTALSTTRKVIADRMADSLSRSPQATVTTRADMSKLVDLRKQLATENLQISYADLFTKIIGLALQENPLFNSSLQSGELIIYKSINIGVAMAAEDSLFVPVIKNVQDKNLRQISAEIKEMSCKVKEGNLSSEDMTGGTFTFSNMGMLDVDVMTPIINPPEAAILAIGSVRKEAVVDEADKIVIRPMVTISLSIDHAILDGFPAAKFLASIKKYMQDPEKLLV